MSNSVQYSVPLVEEFLVLKAKESMWIMERCEYCHLECDANLRANEKEN